MLFPNKQELKQNYESYRESFTFVLQEMEKYLKSNLSMGSMPTVKSRIKHFDSYYKKLLRVKPKIEAGEKLPVLTDLLGLRIICPFLEDLQMVESQIISLFNIIEIERKGSEKTYSEFGYESIHFLVEIPFAMNEEYPLPKNLICEIQVRTILQDAWAEVEHELVYKSEFSPFDLPLRRKLASINASLSLADIIFQEIRDYQSKLNRELTCRREAFYEQADCISKNIISDFSTDISEPPLDVSSNTSSPYVHSTIDDMILDAIQAHNAGDLEKAVDIYTQIIEMNTQINNIVLGVIYKHRGIAKFAMSRFEEALQDFLASCEQDPTNFRSFYYAGIVYNVLEQDEKALEYFSKSIEKNEYQSHTYFRRALTYYHEADYARSMSDLQKAISLGIDDNEVQALHDKLISKLGMDF